MPTCRDIITRALRKLAAIGAGDNPSINELNMGMAALQSMFDGWAAAGMFGSLKDVIATTAYAAKPGERVRSSQPVTLPDYLTDTTSGGDCNQPQNRHLIIVVNPVTGLRQVNLYDAWVGGWVRIDALTPSTECPLSALGADGLACCLARVMADESTWTVGAQTERQASLFMQRLGRGDGQRRDAEIEFF